jgi:hypothetical protein
MGSRHVFQLLNHLQNLMSSENNAYIPQGLQHSKDAQGETFIDVLPSSWINSNMNLK